MNVVGIICIPSSPSLPEGKNTRYRSKCRVDDQIQADTEQWTPIVYDSNLLIPLHSQGITQVLVDKVSIAGIRWRIPFFSGTHHDILVFCIFHNLNSMNLSSINCHTIIDLRININQRILSCFPLPFPWLNSVQFWFYTT